MAKTAAKIAPKKAPTPASRVVPVLVEEVGLGDEEPVAVGLGLLPDE